MSRTPTNRRRPALIAALVALATTLVFALPGAVRPAEATPSTAPRATPATSLKLLLSTVTPAIATADSEVTLTGQVINTGAETVPAPDVRLTGSFTPLAGRDAIAAWATGRPSAIETSLIDHFSTTGDLRPGGRANFILTVPAPGPEGAAFGALPMAISVAGTQLRTFVPMQRRMEYEPLRLSVLVPLTLDPDPALLGTYAAPASPPGAPNSPTPRASSASWTRPRIFLSPGRSTRPCSIRRRPSPMSGPPRPRPAPHGTGSRRLSVRKLGCAALRTPPCAPGSLVTARCCCPMPMPTSPVC